MILNASRNLSNWFHLLSFGSGGESRRTVSLVTFNSVRKNNQNGKHDMDLINL